MGCLVCEQVIVTDNLLTDSDLEALMAFCRPGEGMDFIVNTYQKYKGVKVMYVADATDMLARIHEDLRAGRGCTIPCNTKKQADEIYNILRKHIPEDRLRLYTGEAGQVPHDLDRDWEGCAVVYSPTITTGLDYNPRAPQNVYLFLHTTLTVCPATALQMCTRNRNIAAVCVHASRMTGAKQRSAAAISYRVNITTRSIEQQFTDVVMDINSGEFVHRENTYTELYKAHIAHEERMQGQFLPTLDALFRMRGFAVTDRRQGARMSAAATPKQHGEQTDSFAAYLKGELTDPHVQKAVDQRCNEACYSVERLKALTNEHPNRMQQYAAIFMEKEVLSLCGI